MPNSFHGRRTLTSDIRALQRNNQLDTQDPPKARPNAAPPVGQLFTAERAAPYLGVTPSTVWRWMESGFVKPVTTTSRARMLPLSELVRVQTLQAKELRARALRPIIQTYFKS